MTTWNSPTTARKASRRIPGIIRPQLDLKNLRTSHPPRPLDSYHGWPLLALVNGLQMITTTMSAEPTVEPNQKPCTGCCVAPTRIHIHCCRSLLLLREGEFKWAAWASLGGTK